MSLRIGPVELGPGRPRICVPLTGSTLQALAAEAAAITPDAADLVELRIDRFAALPSAPAVLEAIDAVGAALPALTPVLLTWRTAAEGGGAPFEPEAYPAVLLAGARSSGVAAVDVEMALPRSVVGAMVQGVHDAGKPVVLSFHDLEGTPPREEIVGRLREQQALGADLVKLACTPHSPEDVLTLLAATRAYTDRTDARPAVTMAMGPLGVVSRIAGETFGSCLTFGTVGAASAPGQVDALRLRAAVDLVHEALRP